MCLMFYSTFTLHVSKWQLVTIGLDKCMISLGNQPLCETTLIHIFDGTWGNGLELTNTTKCEVGGGGGGGGVRLQSNFQYKSQLDRK